MLSQHERKMHQFYFCNNSRRCGPISITLSLLQSGINGRKVYKSWYKIYNYFWLLFITCQFLWSYTWSLQFFGNCELFTHLMPLFCQTNHSDLYNNDVMLIMNWSLSQIKVFIGVLQIPIGDCMVSSLTSWQSAVWCLVGSLIKWFRGGVSD